MTHDRNEKRKALALVACMSSLVEAVDQAGGDAAAVMLKARVMTAAEFICQYLAPNGIRFVFDRDAASAEETGPAAVVPTLKD